VRYLCEEGAATAYELGTLKIRKRTQLSAGEPIIPAACIAVRSYKIFIALQNILLNSL
jgi:hypothetical protein